MLNLFRSIKKVHKLAGTSFATDKIFVTLYKRPGFTIHLLQLPQQPAWTTYFTEMAKSKETTIKEFGDNGLINIRSTNWVPFSSVSLCPSVKRRQLLISGNVGDRFRLYTFSGVGGPTSVSSCTSDPACSTCSSNKLISVETLHCGDSKHRCASPDMLFNWPTWPHFT